jgi:hypothetical protein
MYAHPCSCRSISRTIAGAVSPASSIKSSRVSFAAFIVFEQAGYYTQTSRNARQLLL